MTTLTRPSLPCCRSMSMALCVLGLCFGARADPASDIRSLLVAGDPAAALVRAEAALMASPRDLSLRFLRGVVLMDLARTDEALDLFTQLAQEHPDLPDPHNNIGLLQARAGHLDLALLALQDALRCDPAHRVARANLGQVYLMLAARTWDELARSGPVEPALLRRLEAVRVLLKSLPAGDR